MLSKEKNARQKVNLVVPPAALSRSKIEGRPEINGIEATNISV